MKRAPLRHPRQVRMTPQFSGTGWRKTATLALLANPILVAPDEIVMNEGERSTTIIEVKGARMAVAMLGPLCPALAERTRQHLEERF